MKISLNWLKEYLQVELPHEQIGEILTDIGLEVEGVEHFTNIEGGLEGVIIGEVVACEKHMNADKLSVTKVDIGGNEPLPIVCGAPNVAVGQKVLVATVGTMLYPQNGEPFKIKKAKIRGEESQGMICAEDELGLGDDHDGIIVLPESAQVGGPASSTIPIRNDVVYEIGLTPNRSDATSHIGVAKDLAAALKINFDHNGQVTVPDLSDWQVTKNDMSVPVVVENELACPRYSGVSISGIEVKSSPDWFKSRLESIGVRPINNIVDITNFVLHETGQPLHAFDYDKIEGRQILVKTLPQNTAFTTLDEVDRNLDETDLMICDGNSKAMCIAGVFGGMHTGITESSKNVFLESAHFNAKWIRKTSTRHHLRTDAAIRFEKGSDPNGTIYALKRAALLILDLAGGSIASDIVDVYPEAILRREIPVKYHHVNRLLGTDLQHEFILEILNAMNMEITAKSKDGVTVAVPTDKADVLREVDVIEEIIRIYGLNNIPEPTKLLSTISYSQRLDKQKLQSRVSEMLVAQGFCEMMALSIMPADYYASHLGVEEAKLIKVMNTSNVTLDTMRYHMLPGMLEAIARNQNRQEADLKLFEFGRTYGQSEDGIEENEWLTVAISGQWAAENWNQASKPNSFHTLKGVIDALIGLLGVSKKQISELNEKPFHYGLKYHQGRNDLVYFGTVDAKLLDSFDIKQAVFYGELNWQNLLKTVARHKVEIVDLPRFPHMRRDLALVIPNDVKFGDIVYIARKTGKTILKEINLFDVYRNNEQIGGGNKSYAISLIFQDDNKTLNDKEVDKVMSEIIDRCEKELKATIRR